jgi:hypothetical protein
MTTIVRRKRARRAVELDAEAGGRLAHRRRVDRPAGGRELLGGGDVGDRPHEAVEAGGRGDDQPARLVGLDAVGVRHVPRGQRCLDATVAASVAGLRAEFDEAEAQLDAQVERIPDVPHRARYLRLINDYGRRVLDAERAWLDDVERELGR